jgi:Protein of unknown function (DUF2637)
MTAERYTEWDAERHGFRRWNPRDGWQPFGTDASDYPSPDANGVRVLNLAPSKQARETKDQATSWLRGAMLALGLLAAAAAVVSFAAQYHMVYAAKGVQVVAALEAGIPDTAAVVFAALGIALALHGKRALRPRALNLVAVATSIFMNFAAAQGTGWRTVAIWVMPSIAYAVASDTAIGVIRAYTIARQRQLDEGLADEGVTPLDVLGGFLLWLLRLALVPASTLSGFRSWVVESCPVAPGTRAQLPAPQNVAALPAAPTPGSAAAAKSAEPDLKLSPPRSGKHGRPGSPGGARRRGVSKTARFMDLVDERYPGGLVTVDPAAVSRLCAELAPRVDLDAGAARSYLRPRVRQAHADAEAGR